MARYRRVRCTRWPSRRPPEEGFTLIEVMVAMGIMFSALIVLAYTMVGSLSAVGFGRQRTEATALANQALEQIRALPASELYMSSTDLSGDSQLVSCGTDTCFNSRKVPVANFGTNPATTPLVPNHITTTTALPGNTLYTIKSYVTVDPTDPTNHTLVATVQASWSGSQKGGVASKLQVESKIYNAQFNDAPPGVHKFTATAQSNPAIVSVAGTVLNQNNINVTFNLPNTSAGMNGTSIPGTTNVGASTGGLVTGGIAESGITASTGLNSGAGTIKILDTPAISTSAQSLAGALTQGPVTPPSSSPSVLASAPGVLGLDTGSLEGSAGVGAVESVSAVAASAATGGSNTPGSPTPSLPTNNLGYGQGSATQSGAVGANLSVGSVLGKLLTVGLVNLVPSGNSQPDLATVAQNGAPGLPDQQTYTASASQSFTELDVGNVSLLGGAPITVLKLTGFKKTAYACAGPGACVQPPPIDSGNISVLGGPPVPLQNLLSGATSIVNLNALLQSASINLAPVTTLGITGSINLDPGPTTSAHAESVGSPLSITLNLDATVLGVSLLHVSIDISLGSVSASATYS